MLIRSGQGYFDTYGHYFRERGKGIPKMDWWIPINLREGCVCGTCVCLVFSWQRGLEIDNEVSTAREYWVVTQPPKFLNAWRGIWLWRVCCFLRLCGFALCVGVLHRLPRMIQRVHCERVPPRMCRKVGGKNEKGIGRNICWGLQIQSRGFFLDT